MDKNIIENNVVIVGVLDDYGSTNIPMALSFLRIGINIIPVNYRTIIQTYGLNYFYDYLLYTIKKTNPALVLFSKCNGIDPNIVKKCSELTTTWLWNMDPIETIKQCPEVLEHAKNSHFSSCTSPTIRDWFIEHGVENCFFILEGFDYDIMGPEFPEDIYKADVSFIGSRTPTRDKFYEFLKDKFDTRFYGPHYPEGKIQGQDFAKVCSSSKFMLSINTYETPNYCSDRLIRYAGCGACILHYNPNGNNLGDLFDKYKDIMTFKDENELYNLIYNYKDNSEKRRDCSINAREKVLNNYTWDHTILNIIGVLKNASRSSN